MTVRNQSFYDLNESRNYPLDDAAGLLDDTGQRLPHDLLADLNLRFPETLGTRAFLGSLAVTQNIVSVTILGDAGSFSPIGVVSVQRPVNPRAPYAIHPLSPGVSGWIVFGSGIESDQTYNLRFSTSAQSLLLAKTALRLPAVPLSSIGQLATDGGLTGIVKLKGGEDIETAVEERTIEGVLRDVIVVRLKDKLGESSRNLEEIYAGACGQRPESGNCEGLEPIEFINTVSPDCCGNIFVEFRGCADLSAIEDACGVVIDCGFGLSGACITPDRLPDSSGKLPNEYADQCDGFSQTLDLSATTDTIDDYVQATRDFTGSTLPYTETFNDAAAEGLTTLSGEFILIVGGNGAGNVATITQNGATSTVRVKFTETVPASIPASFVVAGSSVSGYNVTHTVTGVVSTMEVNTDVAYSSDATGGTWSEIATGSSGTAGVVYEAQENQENIAVWDIGLPTGFDTIYKRMEAIVAIKPGASATMDNVGIILNYRDNDNFWLVEIDWSNFKTFNVVHKNNGLWQIRATTSIPTLAHHKRYRLSANILPLDEAGGSTSAVVDAKLESLDESTEYSLPDVILPGYLPATGYFGLFSNRSLSWFEQFSVSDYNPTT